MNTVINCLETRRSIRGYKPDVLPDDNTLRQILEAGTYAPTGMGAQSPIMIVVTDKATRNLLSTLNAKVMGTKSDPFYGAPVVVVVLADRNRPTHIYDGSLVMGNLMNAAHALGVGSCWIHRAKEVFDSPEGKKLLKQWGVEGDYEGIGHCVIGYPVSDEAPVAKPRKTDFIRFIK